MPLARIVLRRMGRLRSRPPGLASAAAPAQPAQSAGICRGMPRLRPEHDFAPLCTDAIGARAQPPLPVARRETRGRFSHAEDQGHRHGRRDGRRRDDTHHLEADQGQADPPLPRREPRVLRPRRRAPRRHQRPGHRRRRQRHQEVRRGRQVRHHHPRRGPRQRVRASRRCGARPTAPSATSWAASSSASPSSARTCRAWCPAGPSPSSSAATPTATSTAPPTSSSPARAPSPSSSPATTAR